MPLTQIEISIHRGKKRGFCHIATETGKILPLFNFALTDTDDEVMKEARRILTPNAK